MLLENSLSGPSSTGSEVSNHIHIESSGHHIELDEVKMLVWKRSQGGNLHQSQQAYTQQGWEPGLQNPQDRGTTGPRKKIDPAENVQN